MSVLSGGWSFLRKKSESNPSPKPTSASRPAANDINKKKKEAWIKMTRAAGKKKNPNLNYKQVVRVMHYRDESNDVKCKCGAIYWKTSRHKPSELYDHLSMRQHTTWIDKQSYAQSANSNGQTNTWFSKLMQSLYDIKDEILYYPFLFPTFVILYFLIRYRLPLHLLGPLNAVLVFLAVTLNIKLVCSGTSYLNKVNTMVASFYNVRYNQIKLRIQHSNWFGFQFDESTSKVSSKVV
eukprot:373416_1